MKDTFMSEEERALREIRGLVLEVKDDLFAKLLRRRNLTYLEILKAKEVLRTYRDEGLSDQMEAVLSRYMRWSYDEGLRKIDALLDTDLVKALGLTPNVTADTLGITAIFAAPKIITVAVSLLDALEAKLLLAMTGERTPAEVVNMLRKEFDTSQVNAERIVRTELKGMQNQGEEVRIQQAFTAARRQGIPAEKYWIHSSGQAVGFRKGKKRAKYMPRPHHKAMHGVTVKDGEKFALVAPDGITYRIDGPHDSILPAGEVINCYCDRGLRIKRETVAARTA